MSPYEIQLLFHIYTTPVRFENDHLPLYKDEINSFILNDLIKPNQDRESGFEVTKRGEAMCLAIQKVSIPECVFLDKNGEVILKV